MSIVLDTLKNDYSACADVAVKWWDNDAFDIDRKIMLSATRIFLAAVVVTPVVCFVVKPIIAAVAPLFIVAGVVVGLIVVHDLFKIGVNAQRSQPSQVFHTAKHMISDAFDLATGNKKEDESPSHHLSDGTILAPIWNGILHEYQKYKQGK